MNNFGILFSYYCECIFSINFIMYKNNCFNFKCETIMLKTQKQYQGFKTKEADYYCQSVSFRCYLNSFSEYRTRYEKYLF